MTRDDADVRYFYGLPYPMPASQADTIDAALSAFNTAPVTANIRRVPTQNLHCTLRYLGNLQPESVAPLHEAVCQALPSLRALRLTIDAFDLFPSSEHPNHLVLLPHPSRDLAALAHTIDQIMRAQDLAHDPLPFRAHITYAHLDTVTPSFIECFPIKQAPTTWHPDHLYLYCSKPSQTPNDYEIIATLPWGPS